MIDGFNSEEVAVTIGAPQDSVLCPLLFIIYIKDVDDVLSNLIGNKTTQIGNSASTDEDKASKKIYRFQCSLISGRFP